MKLGNILRGIGGEPELVRTIGAFGVVGYVVGALGFQAWNMGRGVPFDIIAFCTAFPAGLAAALAAVAGAVAIKDRNVATAKATEAQTAAEKQP